MMPGDLRLEALQRYVDGTATREDVAMIERGILHDPVFRKLALEYLYLDGAMKEFAVETNLTPVRNYTDRFRWALGAAAAVALLGASLWHFWPMKVRPAGVEVEVTQLTNAEFAGPAAGIREHERAPLNSLGLRSGEAHLRLPSDVNLVVRGPAEMNFIDPMHVRVLRGKVTVDCGVRGKGFVMDTPVARVVDVSTQFGVEARADGATDVMVIKGSVEIFNPKQSQRSEPLQQGEAVRVDANQSMARIESIVGGAKSEDWSTLPAPADCSIVSVSDNFGSTEGYHFYRIVPHGLKPGAVAYSNRPHVWQKDEAQGFPEALMNTDMVQTFFGELKHPDYAIEVTVARPVELFLLMPRRGLPQPWLTENFTRTGDVIFLDEGDRTLPRHSHLPFDVWKKTVAQPGKIILGPGNRDAGGGPVGMYGIAAKAL